MVGFNRVTDIIINDGKEKNWSQGWDLYHRLYIIEVYTCTSLLYSSEYMNIIGLY